MRKASFLLIALVLAAACGSGSLGDLGNIILGSPSAQQASDIVGTVNSVNTASQMINLDVNTVNNLRTTQNGQSVYYDNNTRVVYGNQTFNVTDLERGDQVSIRGANNGGKYIAETITVTRNVRG